MEKVTKFFDCMYWFFMTTCKIFFIGMVGITVTVIFNRYFIKSPLSWGEPIVLLCMTYMSLVSAALAIRKDTHIRMTVIDFLVPKQAVAVMKCAAHIAIFGFGIFMIVFGWKFAKIVGNNLLTGANIRSIWLYLANPLAGVAIILMEVERLINFIYRTTHHIKTQVKSLKEEAEEMVHETAAVVAEQRGGK